MALYRTVSISFWTDSKVVDEFTPEDRYFYLYLFTNPHTNLSGCYEISKKQMSSETGYKTEMVTKILERFINVHQIVDYDTKTKEILLINWYKHNWTKSEKYRKPLKREIDDVKNENFKNYLTDLYEGNERKYGIDTYCIDTVSIPYRYGSDTPNTNTITNTNTISITNTNTKKPEKLSYGDNNNVKLSIEEYEKLVAQYGQEDTNAAIQYLDGYIEDKGYKSKSNYSAIKRWVIDAIRENKGKKTKVNDVDEFFKKEMGL